MLAKYTPAVKTPLTFEQAAAAMREALTAKLGAPPTVEAMALALAKTALETGRWQAIYCFNWGNIKASPSYQGSYCCIELNEVLGGKVVWFAPSGRIAHKGGPAIAEFSTVPPGHPQTRMRAHATAAEGAKAYVDFVAGGRYAAAWQRLLAGDAVGYATMLRQAGYYTAPLADYLKGVVSLQREFISKLTPAASPAPAAPVTLKRGAQGPSVQILQELLNRHGAFPVLKPDGDFGERTHQAVRVFQQESRLIADGVVGARTWAALKRDTLPAPPPSEPAA